MGRSNKGQGLKSRVWHRASLGACEYMVCIICWFSGCCRRVGSKGGSLTKISIPGMLDIAWTKELAAEVLLEEWLLGFKWGEFGVTESEDSDDTSREPWEWWFGRSNTTTCGVEVGIFSYFCNVILYNVMLLMWLLQKLLECNKLCIIRLCKKISTRRLIR